MIEAIALGLGIALILSAIGNVYAWLTTRKMVAAPEAVLAAGKAQIAAERNLIEAQRQRDLNQAVLEKTAGELQDALALLRACEAQRNDAQEENADATADEIRNADNPVDALSDVLQDVPDVSRASASGEPAADGDRQGQGDLHPAEAGGPSGDRRRP